MQHSPLFNESNGSMILLGEDPSNASMGITANATEALQFKKLPEIPEPPLYIYITVSVLYSLIFLCGVVGNSLVIFVVWRNKDMRNSTNYFLTNLSVADLLVIVVCMPSAFIDLYAKEVWYLGPFMCEYILYRKSI